MADQRPGDSRAVPPSGEPGQPNQPLSPLDAAFLAVEDEGLPMHIGAVLVFEQGADAVGGRLTPDRLRRLVRSRLHRVPRYRQRPVSTPLHLDHPWWVDDPAFDLDDHLHVHRLPAPAGHDQLLGRAADILARPLERARPLWELHLIEGLADDRVGLVGKIHHAVADGVAGARSAARLLATEPGTVDLAVPRPWVPEPAPGSLRRAAAGLGDQLRTPVQLARAARDAVRHPGRSARRLARAGLGLVSLMGAQGSGPVAAGPLNRVPGPGRRLAGGRLDLAAVAEVAEAHGATVNDVVLALVMAATGRWLRRRGESTRETWARVLVPVNVREEPDDGRLGNHVSGMVVRLPLSAMDADERLRICRERMAVAKTARQAEGADLLLRAAGGLPPVMHARGARAAAHARLFDFVVSNVPGPTGPLHCLGARLAATYPFVPLGPFQPFAVGVTSAGGALSLGFTADDRTPRLGELPDLLAGALGELGGGAARAAPIRLDDRRPGGAGEPGLADGSGDSPAGTSADTSGDRPAGTSAGGG